jgi:hypothetical protein
MANLRLVNVLASPAEMRTIGGAVRRLFPGNWAVELVGDGSPLVVSLSIRDGQGTALGRGLFQPNHLVDVPPYLERMAAVARAKGLLGRTAD